MKRILIISLSLLSLIMSYVLLDKSFNKEVIITIPVTKHKESIPSKQIKIAILDTGLRLLNESDVTLCEDAKRIDFTKDQDNIDMNGHGTNIAYIIADRLKGLNYCITMIKVFSSINRDNSDLLYSLIMAYNFVIENNYDVLNLSFGGYEPMSAEQERIMTLLNKNVSIFAAAGNEGKELTNDNCIYFPACYSKQIHTIGNSTSERSNHGEYVREWEDGTSVYGGGYRLTGTSQATAIATAKYVRRLLK